MPSNSALPRLQVLWGLQQSLMLLIYVMVFGPAAALFLLEPPPGEESDWEVVLIALLFFGALAVLVLVLFAKTLVVVGPRGLRVSGRGWLAWEQVLDVQVKDVDERIFPIEAPVLRLDVPFTYRGPGAEEALTGLGGYRILSCNRRVWRDANRIRRWAQLPPLPLPATRREPPPQGIPRRAKGVSEAEREMVEELATYARSCKHTEGVEVEEHQVAGLPTFVLRPGGGKPSLSVVGQQWIVIESDSGLGWELDYTPQGMTTAKLLIDHAVAGTLTRRSDGSTSLASKIMRWLSPPTGRPEHG